MERIQHAGGVLEPVIDGVLVALERVKGGNLDSAPECCSPLVEPVTIDRPGPTRNEIEQPGGGMRTTCQVDHPGELF